MPDVVQSATQPAPAAIAESPSGYEVTAPPPAQPEPTALEDGASIRSGPEAAAGRDGEPRSVRSGPTLATELGAVVRILWSVSLFRLRKREMANFAGAVSVMLALGLSWRDGLWRAIAAAGMNLLVYLNNDYLDLPADLASPTRAGAETSFLAAHRRAALIAHALLSLGLLVVGVVAGWGVLLSIVVAVAAAFLYSARGKRVPFADLVLIATGATGLGMVAAPIDSPLGWCLALQLGLAAACFQAIQSLRDLREDESFGIRTTAVRLGVDRTLLLARVIVLVNALFGACALHRWWGIGLAAAAVLPCRRDRIDRFWNQVRLVFGIGWLLIVASTVMRGRSWGWLLQVAATDRIEWLSALAKGPIAQ